MSAKYWCFTYNNPTHYPEELGALFANTLYFIYCVFQLECGESGTQHYQGYAEFDKRVSRKHISDSIGVKLHLEIRRGSQAEARNYAMKADSRIHGPYEYGEFKPTKQGQRNDLKELRDKVLKGTPMKDIIPTVDNFQQLRFAQALSSYVPLSHDRRPKKVYWLWGPTGAGKTLTAMKACPVGNTWFANNDCQWFDGYCGQTHVIIDEFRAKNWPYDMVLRLLDGYEMSLPVKGGFTRWCPKEIWITCPLPPSEVYFRRLQNHGSIDQLMRRITEVRELQYRLPEDDGMTTDEDNESDQDLTTTEVLNHATLESSTNRYVAAHNRICNCNNPLTCACLDLNN